MAVTARWIRSSCSRTRLTNCSHPGALRSWPSRSSGGASQDDNLTLRPLARMVGWTTGETRRRCGRVVSSVLELTVALVLIALNGVFSLSELAIVSARKVRLKVLADQGRRGAKA